MHSSTGASVLNGKERGRRSLLQLSFTKQATSFCRDLFVVLLKKEGLSLNIYHEIRIEEDKNDIPQICNKFNKVQFNLKV